MEIKELESEQLSKIEEQEITEDDISTYQNKVIFLERAINVREELRNEIFVQIEELMATRSSSSQVSNSGVTNSEQNNINRIAEVKIQETETTRMIMRKEYEPLPDGK